MRTAFAVGVWLMILPLPRMASAPPTDFWKGQYAIFQYHFMYGKDIRNENRVSRSVWFREFDYDLYQNDAGIAREELTHMNTNRSVEGPLDVRLLDYTHRNGRVWDKGGTQVIEGPLSPLGPGKSLGTRQILGFACEGKEYEWTTFQHAKVQLESWSAKDSTFKVPLLRVQHYTDDAGALLSVTVEVVMKLGTATDLPASLFEPPEGMQVSKVPAIE